MNEEKNTNLGKNFSVIIGVLIMIGLIAGFIIAYNNTINQKQNVIELNTTQKNTESYAKNETSSEIISESSTNQLDSTVSSGTKVDNTKNVNITSGGTYDLEGSYESVSVNTDSNVVLNLNNVEIINSDGPAINILEAKSVTIVLSGDNKISSTTVEDLDGAIYSKADLVFAGTGSLTLKSNYDGIVSKDTLAIRSGTYTIEVDDDAIKGKDSVEISGGTFTINAGGDGIKASNDTDSSLGYVSISGGTFNINAKSDGIQGITKVLISGGVIDITALEGIEGTYIKIDDGTINIAASDDGLNASEKSTIGTPTVEINGGNITISMGQGDTDGIDSNGNIYINGGTISITGNSAFDYNNEAKYNGGTIIVNGTQTNAITNQFGGGMPGGRQNGFPSEMDSNMSMPNGGYQNGNKGGRFQ